MMEAQLAPRRSGEELVLEETVLKKRRQRNIQQMADRSINIKEIHKQRKRNEHRQSITNLHTLVKSSRDVMEDRRRVAGLVKKRKLLSKCTGSTASLGHLVPYELLLKNSPNSSSSGDGGGVHNMKYRVMVTRNPNCDFLKNKHKGNSERQTTNTNNMEPTGVTTTVGVSGDVASSPPPQSLHLRLPKTHIKECLEMLNSSNNSVIGGTIGGVSMARFVGGGVDGKDIEEDVEQEEIRIIREDFVRVSRKVVLIVRNEINDPSRPTLKVLLTLGLRRCYDSVFVPADGVHCEMLNIIHPYVFYGFPTKQTIDNLFLRKAVFKATPRNNNPNAPTDNHTPSISSLLPSLRTPGSNDILAGAGVLALTDNVIIEQRLGHLGLLCVEDLIDEVWNCGRHFRAIQEELGSFRLCRRRKVDGVFYRHRCFGNFDASINLLVSKLI
eukprot:GHVS01103556.1.p1 GENE.GHVS01103556.1~~GHVS01103556.1.p1  ORF type:complete len:440 (+),score=85.15 GHVS01103556.1:148-1467(+)